MAEMFSLLFILKQHSRNVSTKQHYIILQLGNTTNSRRNVLAHHHTVQTTTTSILTAIKGLFTTASCSL